MPNDKNRLYSMYEDPAPEPSGKTYCSAHSHAVHVLAYLATGSLTIALEQAVSQRHWTGRRIRARKAMKMEKAAVPEDDPWTGETNGKKDGEKVWMNLKG